MLIFLKVFLTRRDTLKYYDHMFTTEKANNFSCKFMNFAADLIKVV
jgi:hypothetical protein